MLRFTEEEFQAFSERRNKGRSRPKTKKDPFLSLAPVKEVSPHAKALAALAKNPDLRDGNCEHFEQVFIFDYFERKHPDIYELLHATPNGGKRSKATAGKMKAEGQKKGYPDMSLDKACGIYHGMRIELKEPNGKAPTKEQIAWMRRLREEGYYVVLAYGAEQAITAILEYMSLKKGEAIEHVLNGDKWLYAALNNKLISACVLFDVAHINIGRIIVSSKANYESLASVMPRNEQEADAVVDPVIAEMNARLEAEFAAENEHTTQGD